MPQKAPDNIEINNNITNHLNHNLNTKINSDWIGISSSILCLIHCLILPIAFVTGSSLITHKHLDLFGINFNIDYIFGVISLFAAYYSSRHAHKKYIKYMFLVGWLTFIIGMTFLKETPIFYFMHIGTAILIITHIQNIRICRNNHCDHTH